MAICPSCGKPLKDGDRFCGECGAVIEQKSQYSRGPEPTVSEPMRPSWEKPAQQPVWAQPAQPQQPVWAQYGGQPTGNPTFYVPKRPLGKGGGVTMIVFGSIMLGFYLFFMLAGLMTYTENSYSKTYVTNTLIPMLVTLGLTLFAGGLMLLLFGIRKIRNVNRYNASLNDPR
jgi:hypothetical protein